MAGETENIKVVLRVQSTNVLKHFLAFCDYADIRFNMNNVLKSVSSCNIKREEHKLHYLVFLQMCTKKQHSVL